MYGKATLSRWFFVYALLFALACSIGIPGMFAYAEEGEGDAGLVGGSPILNTEVSTAADDTDVAITENAVTVTENAATLESAAVLTAESPTTLDVASVVEEDIPESFDLRNVDTDGDGEGDRCYVTPVKFQNPFGTCWGFAAIAAAETSILGSHFADDPEAYLSLDLSEKQLAFFSHTFVNDPNSSQYREGIYSAKYDLVDGDVAPVEPLTMDDYFTGGTPFLATNTLSAGSGPTRESRDDVLVYKGKNGEVIYLDGTPYCYSPNDDWLLSEEYRFMQDYVLNESYMLPSPAAWSNGEYVYNEQATLAIKKQLMQIRAVEIGFHADESRPWDTGFGQFMNVENWAHYTYWDPLPNHAVVIVGWDDNYDANNFAHVVYALKEDSDFTYKPENFKTDEHGNYIVDEAATAASIPPANGAWLIKNSWGSGEQDFPNRGTGDWGIPVQKKDANGNLMFDDGNNPVMVGSGYFWLSYYDRTIVWPEVLIFDTALTGIGSTFDQSTLHRNQYDLMPVTAMQAKESDKLVKSANLFASADGEDLMCVSYITSTPNTTVTVEVYLLNDGFTSPEDGVLVGSNSETHEHAGFYIDYLGDTPVPIHIQPGQSYSVVITQQQDTGKYAVNYPTNIGLFNILIELGFADYGAYAVQNGESLLYSDDVWASWGNEGVRDVFLELYEEIPIAEGMTITQKDFNDYALTMQYDNFPIKTYAFDRAQRIFARLAGESNKMYTHVGNDASIASLELFGEDSEGLTIADFANDAIDRESIVWSLEDGSENLVVLMPSADGTQAQIKALAPGTAYVVANIKGVGRVIIPVEVSEAPAPEEVTETPSRPMPASYPATKASASPKTADGLPLTAIMILLFASGAALVVCTRKVRQ